MRCEYEREKDISLIIPTYNERDNVLRLIELLAHTLGGENYEIVIVDDNSPDGTAELAESFNGKYPITVVVRNNKNGLASAVVDGFRMASGRIWAIMDADLQHPPEILPKLVDEINKGADLVIASRYVFGGACYNWGMRRRLMSKGAIFLAHMFLSQTRQIHDPMSGCFMFKKELIDITKLNPRGYKILLELLITQNFEKIIEVPYTFRNRSHGKSKLNVTQLTEYLRHIFALMKG